MQYKTGKIDDPIKPYRKPRLTDANCAISISKQARLYREHMIRTGQKVVHVFPNRNPLSHACQTRDRFLHFETVDVDPKDWK